MVLEFVEQGHANCKTGSSARCMAGAQCVMAPLDYTAEPPAGVESLGCYCWAF